MRENDIIWLIRLWMYLKQTLDRLKIDYVSTFKINIVVCMWLKSNILYPKKCPHSYIFNKSVQKLPILINFGTWYFKEIGHLKIINLSSSTVHHRYLTVYLDMSKNVIFLQLIVLSVRRPLDKFSSTKWVHSLQVRNFYRGSFMNLDKDLVYPSVVTKTATSSLTILCTRAQLSASCDDLGRGI